MEALGRWVRLIFGIRAWMSISLPISLYAGARIYWDDRVEWLSPVRHGLILGMIGVLSLIAWLALKRGWRSARIWALIASVGSTFDGPLGIGIGIAGVIAFWNPAIVAKVAGKSKSNKSEKGDGTSGLIDKAMPYVVFAALVVARSWWAGWGDAHDLPPSSVPGWLMVIVAVHLCVVFHEAGHYLAGVSSDMVLRNFQLGPFRGEFRGGCWRYAFKPAGLLGGGLVGMAPTHLRNIRGRMVLMILGGPVASLLVGSIATLLALSASGMPWQSLWAFLATFGTLGLLDFVANLTPGRENSNYSDGAQIYQLIGSGDWAERHMAGAMVASSLVSPCRPRDFDEGTLKRAADSMPHGERGLHLGLYLAMHYLDSGQTELGIAAWRTAVDQDPEASAKLKADSAAELVFYEAAIAEDLERARRWWQHLELQGGSRKEVDYWKARTALLLAEGKPDEAAQAFGEADQFARKLPQAGAYEYDRWCVDILRRKLNPTDLERLNQATLGNSPVPTLIS